MLWQVSFWGVGSMGSRASHRKNFDSRVGVWYHQILKHLEALSSLMLYCSLFREAWHKATWFEQLHIFHCLYCLKLLQGVTLTWAFLHVHEEKCRLTGTHCFCLWLDSSYSFLPYFLLLREFLNYGIVLRFIFPLLSFLISLLNNAESRLHCDDAESFFQVQESIKGLKGSLKVFICSETANIKGAITQSKAISLY